MNGPARSRPAALLLSRFARALAAAWLGAFLFGAAWLAWPDRAELAQDPGYLARYAERVTDLDRPPQTPEDRPVLFTGTLQVLERHQDTFGLGSDDILYAKRFAELYVWRETPQGDLSRTHGVPLYPEQVRYALEWSEKPLDSRGYVVRRGHENRIDARLPGHETIAPDRMLLGRLDVFKPELLTWLDPLQPLPPAAAVERRQLPHDKTYVYLYAQGKGAAAPQAGDARYHYLGLRLPTSGRRTHELSPVTILGTRDGAAIRPFRLPDGGALYAIQLGDAESFLDLFPPPALGLRLRRFAAFAGLGLGLVAWLFAGVSLQRARRALKESA